MRVDRKALIGALRKVKPVLRGPMAMYQAVLMASTSRPDELRLTISGTNGQEAVSVEIEVQDDSWTSQVVVAEVGRLLRWLEGEWEDEVTLAVEKDRLVVAGGAKVKLGTLPAEDFPEVPSFPENGEVVAGAWMRSEVEELKAAARWCDPTDLRPQLHGVHGSGGDLIAGNGGRLYQLCGFTKKSSFYLTKETIGLLDGLVDDGCPFEARKNASGRLFFQGEGFCLSQGGAEGSEQGGVSMRGLFERQEEKLAADGEEMSDLLGLIRAIEVVAVVHEERSKMVITPFPREETPNCRTLVELQSDLGPAEAWFEGYFPPYKTVYPGDLVLALRQVERSASTDSEVVVLGLPEANGLAFEVRGPEGVRCRVILAGAV